MSKVRGNFFFLLLLTTTIRGMCFRNGKVDGSGNDVHTDVDDNSLNNSTGDVVMVESGIPREKDRGLIIPKDAYHLVITRDLSGKSAEASSQLLANVLNRLTENYLYLNDDGPKMSKLAERADELRKELMSAQKEVGLKRVVVIYGGCGGLSWREYPDHMMTTSLESGRDQS